MLLDLPPEINLRGRSQHLVGGAVAVALYDLSKDSVDRADVFLHMVPLKG